MYRKSYCWALSLGTCGVYIKYRYVLRLWSELILHGYWTLDYYPSLIPKKCNLRHALVYHVKVYVEYHVYISFYSKKYINSVLLVLIVRLCWIAKLLSRLSSRSLILVIVSPAFNVKFRIKENYHTFNLCILGINSGLRCFIKGR